MAPRFGLFPLIPPAFWQHLVLNLLQISFKSPSNFLQISYLSPYLLRISFAISFTLFAFLSVFYPCFEGDEEILSINKLFTDSKSAAPARSSLYFPSVPLWLFDLKIV